MKTITTLAVASLILISSCSIAPVNGHYESARTLKKKNIEATGFYTNYSDVETEYNSVNNNYGVRVGYGITDNFDLKLRYERIVPSSEEARDVVGGVNFFSLSPKVGLVENVLSFKLPLSLYAYNDGESGTEFVMSPTVFGTLPINQKFEAGLAVSYHLFFENEESVYNDGTDFLGLSLGFGISQDLDRWAIRPEIGYNFITDGFDFGYLNVGVGFTYNINLLDQ